MKPQSFNHNDVNAVLDALEANAYYLYYSSSGTGPKRYWFFTKRPFLSSMYWIKPIG